MSITEKFYLGRGEIALFNLYDSHEGKRRSWTWNHEVFHFREYLRLKNYKVTTRLVKSKRPYFRVTGTRIPVPAGTQIPLFA